MNYMHDRYAYSLAYTYGLMPLDESKYEPFDDVGPLHGIRLCHKADHSCLYVKFDVTKLPQE